MSNKTLKSNEDATESAPKKSKSRTRTYIFLIVLILVIGALGALLFVRSNNKTTTEKSNCIRVESNESKCLLTYDLAQSPEEQAKGLSGRTSLAENQGLIFIFVQPGVQCFWMKDMRFPIDIIWMNANKEIVHIEQNVSPSTYPNAFCPNVDAQYVLEVNAGVADKLNIRPDQKLFF